jgi:hypothetical protein
MNFNDCIGDHVDVRTLKNFNTLISCLSLVGWLLMTYINFKVPFAWEFGDWVVSPYLVLLGIAVFQILAYPTSTAIDSVIYQRNTPFIKQPFTFQKLMGFIVIVMMTIYIALITQGYLKQKHDVQGILGNPQVIKDLDTIMTKGCELSGHKVKYNFYLKPIIVSDKQNTDKDYSSYLSDQVSIAKAKVRYRCATGEQVITNTLIRSFLN